jgi:hypothetical protein
MPHKNLGELVRLVSTISGKSAPPEGNGLFIVSITGCVSSVQKGVTE